MAMPRWAGRVRGDKQNVIAAREVCALSSNHNRASVVDASIQGLCDAQAESNQRLLTASGSAAMWAYEMASKYPSLHTIGDDL